MGCDLCDLKGKAGKLYDDSICTIIECQACKGAPLGILKRHVDRPSREERDHLFRMLRQAGTKKYGKDGFFLDEGQREHEGHYHVHARKL
jgi:hypothetical protein